MNDGPELGLRVRGHPTTGHVPVDNTNDTCYDHAVGGLDHGTHVYITTDQGKRETQVFKEEDEQHRHLVSAR